MVVPVKIIAVISLAGIVSFGEAILFARMAYSQNAFTIDLRLSDASANRLQRMGEKVKIMAYYSGEPKPGVKPNEDGEIDLGSESREIRPQSQIVSFQGTYDQRTALRKVKGQPRLLINVYSARRAHRDNLLDCGIYDGSIFRIPPRYTIRCKLIYADGRGRK